MIERQVKLPPLRSFFLFGPRQTGKSTLINLLFPEAWQVNFLHTDLYLKYSKNPELLRKEVEEQLRTKKVKTIFLDEVQRVPEILNEVHYLIEKYSIQFILSGSSARKLKRADANLLAGRALQRFLFPLTLQELGAKADLDKLLRFGSLPQVYLSSEEDKIEILKAYTNTYLREEIQQEGLVRNLGGFSRFLDITAAQCGEIVNYSNIARECMLPIKTVQSYYEILEDTLLGIKLHPWQKSVRKRLVCHPKFYMFDIGVTNSINQRLTAIPDAVLRGRLFEQFIVLEIFRQIAYRNSEAQMFFWRTNIGTEVDIVLTKNNKVVAAVEIKSSKSITNADARGLASFYEDYPVQGYIVATVNEPYRLGSTLVLSWQQFLLRELPALLI